MDRSAEEEIVGLFGFNAEKKLKKAEEYLAREIYYEARLAFEEIIIRKDVNPTLASRAREGWRRSRKALMEAQIEEAKRMIRAGEPAAARDSCLAAIEQAAEDLDAGEAKTLLERLDEGQTEAARLLAGLDEVPLAHQLPPEEAADSEAGTTEGAEAMFEVLLQPLPEEQAQLYRDFGPEFRDGYLLLQEGRAAEALGKFAEIPEEVASNPFFRLEKGQALMHVKKYQEALESLEGIELAPEAERRRSEIRTVLLHELGRKEEAVDAARRMWESDREDRDAAILYAEMLLEAERAEEAEKVIDPFHSPAPEPEVDGMLVRTYLALGKAQEARDLLEGTVEGFFQNPAAFRRGFPIWAGRDLLGFYISVREDPKRVRSLVQHLIGHDPGSAERYKALLSDYVKSRTS
jgi:predicted Zn-dependent protease